VFDIIFWPFCEWCLSPVMVVFSYAFPATLVATLAFAAVAAAAVTEDEQGRPRALEEYVGSVDVSFAKSHANTVSCRL
jgi:hypothetical protein